LKIKMKQSILKKNQLLVSLIFLYCLLFLLHLFLCESLLCSFCLLLVFLFLLYYVKAAALANDLRWFFFSLFLFFWGPG
jgi:hypothetical protein